MANNEHDNDELHEGETSEPKENRSINLSSVDLGKVDDSPEKAKETTRSSIARFYVYAFFGTILVTFIIGVYKCFEVKDYRDMLITVSGILSGPLGFIIGYYFKSVSLKD